MARAHWPAAADLPRPGRRTTDPQRGLQPDGQRLAAAYSDKRIRIWDVRGDQEPHDWEAHRSTVHCVVFSPDGKCLASSCISLGWEGGPAGGEANVWDAATGKELLTFRGQPQGVLSLAFSPDGRRVASGGEEKTVKVWDATTSQEVWTSPEHTAPVRTVAFSLDGRCLASAEADYSELSHGEVKLWDAQTGERRRTLRGHVGYLHSIAFSPTASASPPRAWIGRSSFGMWRPAGRPSRSVATSSSSGPWRSGSWPPRPATARSGFGTSLEEKPGEESRACGCGNREHRLHWCARCLLQ